MIRKKHWRAGMETQKITISLPVNHMREQEILMQTSLINMVKAH